MKVHPKMLGIFTMLLLSSSVFAQTVSIEGTKQRWHKVTVKLTGPSASETDSNNPFLNYRFDVTFTHPATGTTYRVPGYFAADGNAANTSASSGNKWKAHLSPDYTGTWNYDISFRQGNNVSVADNPNSGSALSPYNGVSGSFNISESNKSGNDFRAKANGRLKYVGKRYLKFSGSDRYFIKQGPDSPENFLAYADFDGPWKNDGIYSGSDSRIDFDSEADSIKTWSDHVSDWNSGDPTWQGGKGKGMIGAINYLADKGMNLFSFLTFNAPGDDRNVFPHIKATANPSIESDGFVSDSDQKRFDVSKLAQWEIILEHGTKKGMFLHFKLGESENKTTFNNGNLGLQRKLYYRELIARFSHHLALNWNLSEEIANSTSQIEDYSNFFKDNDPYNHLIVFHTRTSPGEYARYDDHIGSTQTMVRGSSLQTGKNDYSDVHAKILEFVSRTEDSGISWINSVDESGGSGSGLGLDSNPSRQDTARKYGLWGALLAGSAGGEWYFGFIGPESDIHSETFKNRDRFWDYARYAKDFFYNFDLPFVDMLNHNELIGNSANDIQKGFCFAQKGKAYVVYLPNGGTTNLNLSGQGGQYNVKWFDPRNGGNLQSGSVQSISGGSNQSLGNAPNNSNKDWVIYITLDDDSNSNIKPSVSFISPNNNQTFDEPATISLVDVAASDSDGSIANVKLYLNGTFIRQEGKAPYEWTSSKDHELNNLPAGSHILKAVATDNEGATKESSITIQVGAETDFKEIPGRIEAEDYDDFLDTTEGNRGGKYRDDDVDIGSTSDQGGGFNIGSISKGEWLSYNVDIADAAVYKVTFRIASARTDDKTLHIELDGQNVSGPVTFNTAGAGWQSFQDVTTEVNLPKGKHVLKVLMDSSSFNLNYIDFELKTAPEQSSTSIGNNAFITDVFEEDGTYTIATGGKDIWGKADGFGFVHQDASGDIEVIAKVESIVNTHDWAKSGVMIRESLDAGSKHASTLVTPQRGISFQRRILTGQNSSHSTKGGLKAPHWVKVVRINNLFTGYFSADGNLWFPINTVSIDMSEDTKVGMALSAHTNVADTSSEISNFSVKTTEESLSVSKFILVNTDTNKDIRTVHHNETISLSEIGVNFTVRAEVVGNVKSVEFDLDEDKSVDNTSSYTLTEQAWNPSKGTCTLMATPFTNSNGSGTMGHSLGIVLKVID